MREQSTACAFTARGGPHVHGFDLTVLGVHLFEAAYAKQSAVFFPQGQQREAFICIISARGQSMTLADRIGRQRLALVQSDQLCDVGMGTGANF